MTRKELFEYVDAHENEYIERLKPLLRKQTISYTASVDTMMDCAQLLLSMLEADGFTHVAVQ